MTAELKTLIQSFIEQRVASAGTVTRYRRPLVGFADAQDPLWLQLKEIVGPHHLLPADLLPDARTAVAIFLPFAEEIVLANRSAPAVAREWAVAYLETNALINQMVSELRAMLAEQGIRTANQPATYNFDPVTLTSEWSHRSAAVIAGLGSFGLNHMLITDSGCAGRCGSFVLNAAIEPTPRRPIERCQYFYDGSCRACVEACPIGALREAQAGEANNIDKHRCYDYLLNEATRHLKPALPADCCGKCALGPCALSSAVPLR